MNEIKEKVIKFKNGNIFQKYSYYSKRIKEYKHGKYYEGYQNGNPKIIATYVKDKRVGLYQEFNKQNEIVFQINFIDEKCDGKGFSVYNDEKHEIYYDNGKSLTEDQYNELLFDRHLQENFPENYYNLKIK